MPDLTPDEQFEEDIRVIEGGVYGKDVRAAISDAIQRAYNSGGGGGGGSLSPNSVDTIHLKDDAVKTAKIYDGAVTKEKLSTALQDAMDADAHAVQQLLMDGANTEVEYSADTPIVIAGQTFLTHKYTLKYIKNVRVYGAKGDGVTDDTTAFNEAFTACKNDGGGIVFIPAGTYIIGGNYPSRNYCEFYSNTHIIGVPGATVLTYPSNFADDGATATGIQSLLRNHTDLTMGGYSATENVIIEGITFDGRKDMMHKSTHLGVGHAKNITVRNCIFKNKQSNCSSSHYLEFNAVQNGIIENCSFYPSWHFAIDRDDQYATDFAAYPIDSSDLVESWKKVGGKWNEQQRVYGEYINIDEAEDGAYGYRTYYLADHTVCDNVTIKGCYFESYPSNYFLWDLGGGAHGGYYTDHNITSESAASAAIPRQPYISYAIGAHYYKPSPYIAERNVNIHIHDNYFVGDWNVGYINKNPNQIRNDAPPATQDYDNLSIPPRRYTITDSYMTGESDGWVIRNNTFRSINTGSNEHPNRLPVGIEINSNQTHNFIHDNTFISYDIMLYPNTKNNQHYWNNVNVQTDGTVVVEQNLTS